MEQSLSLNANPWTPRRVDTYMKQAREKIKKFSLPLFWGLHFSNICISLGQQISKKCINVLLYIIYPSRVPVVSRQVSLDLCTLCQVRAPKQQQLQVPRFPWETDVHLRQDKAPKKWLPGSGTSHGVRSELSAFFPWSLTWKPNHFSICLGSYPLVSQPCTWKYLIDKYFPINLWGICHVWLHLRSSHIVKKTRFSPAVQQFVFMSHCNSPPSHPANLVSGPLFATVWKEWAIPCPCPKSIAMKAGQVLCDIGTKTK